MSRAGSRVPTRTGGDPPTREVLLEFRPIGGAVKVTAIDPITQIEVSIQGPATAGEAELRRIAIAKLDYVLSRKA